MKQTEPHSIEAYYLLYKDKNKQGYLVKRKRRFSDEAKAMNAKARLERRGIDVRMISPVQFLISFNPEKK